MMNHWLYYQWRGVGVDGGGGGGVPMSYVDYKKW